MFLTTTYHVKYIAELMLYFTEIYWILLNFIEFFDLLNVQ